VGFRNLKNEEAMARVGPQCPRERGRKKYKKPENNTENCIALINLNYSEHVTAAKVS